MKITNNSIFLTFLITFSFVGCVSKSLHEKQVSDLQNEVKIKSNELNQTKDENKNLVSEKEKLQTNLLASTKDRGALKANLDEMKKAMDEMYKRQNDQKMRLQEFEDLTSKFKSLTDSGALSVAFIDGKMVVNLGSDVLFSSGSAKLSSTGLSALKEVATKLKEIPGKRYQIEGHTDNLPIATAFFPSNWELASARAINVTKFMIENGMPTERVSAASYGDTRPRQSNDTVEGKAANRRIAIVIVPDLSTLPGYEELTKRNQ